jgi:hypothetical protein
MRFFILNWFGQKNPSELMNKHLTVSIFDFGFEFAEIFKFSCIPRIIRIRKFSFHVLSEYGNFPSAYYQNMEIFIPRIIRIRTVKFSLNIYLIPRIIRIRKFYFRILSEYGNFHSAYSQYTYRLILRILRMRPNSFEYSVLNYFHSSF